MPPRSTVVLALSAFGLGAVLGHGNWSGTLVAPVKAAPGDSPSATSPANDISLLQQGSTQLAKISQQVTPSVVHIESRRETQGKKHVEETGSGVIITSTRANGFFVVTNRHVIDGAELQDIAIALHDGRVIYPESVKTDKATDLAVLKLGTAGLTPAKLGDSGHVEIGHMVLAVGSPFGLSQSVTFGIISAKGRRSLKLGAGSEVLNQDFLQTDAAINPGNSGGPLIDLHGRVIGINTAIASSSGGNEGIGFSIPSNLVQRVVDQLLEFGVVQRAYLGVKLDPAFDLRASRRLGLQDRVTGSRVTEVYPNTPAAKANLQFDDVILSFDGTDVQDENHLINLVSLTPVGKQVRLVIWRGNRKIQIQVLLTARNETPQTSEAPSEPGLGTPIRQMGMTVHPLDDDLTSQLGYPATTAGVLILKVDPQSKLAGQLQTYDVIEEVARQPVRSVDDLLKTVQDASGHDSILLRVRRLADGAAQDHLVIFRP